jgi:L-asparaginase/Glu-tRNA(Gln) amidotransferase subunit D
MQEFTYIHQFNPGTDGPQVRTLLDCLHEGGMKAVIFDGYARGSGPDSLIEMVKDFSSQGIMFFMTSRYNDGDADYDAADTYDSAKQYANAGVVGLRTMKATEALPFINGLLNKGLSNEEIIGVMKKTAKNHAATIGHTQAFPSTATCNPA